MKEVNFCEQMNCEEPRLQQERHESKQACWLHLNIVKVLEQIQIKKYETQKIKGKRW